MPQALDWFMTQTGILTDELADLPTPSTVSGAYTGIDSRQDLSLFENDYVRLNNLRGQAREARGFVQAYAPDSSSALAGHLYAEEGYAELWLADLFCSGIPLSTVDFNGDYTLAAGSTTQQVYEHAAALFDSALSLTSDSARLQSFAAVGRGRALLALGRYAEAGTAVASVPDDYKYQFVFASVEPGRSSPSGSGALAQFRLLSLFVAGDSNYAKLPATPSMANNEGLNGLDYRSSGDPRTQFTAKSTDHFGNTYYFPNKYPAAAYPETGPVTLTVADGIEARLIEAEAALQAGDAATWLAKLNHLRETAISPALPDTSDPGAADARIDLLFRERAFWLYLTGHRQGDLRRLVRQYLRPADAVYPSGVYPGAGGRYGAEVVAPVPKSELDHNPNYSGCFHGNA